MFEVTEYDNLIKITPLTCSLLLISRSVRDLKKLHYGSHVSDLHNITCYPLTKMVFR
jgi:hypothetical protein